MIKYSKLIFVSNSDTCRGPLAAGIMNEKKKEFVEMNQLSVESRGIVVLFPEPMNPKTVAIASSKQIYLSEHVSNELKEADFGMDILVLTMTDSIKKKIYESYKEAVNVFTLKEFVAEDGDIEAAYGGELTEYAELYNNMERLVEKLALKLEQ